jgi:DNA-binding NarL/FixJ family response regulator
MIKVAVFEDNTHLRESFRLLLQEAEGLECVATFSNANDAVDQLRNLDCQVILMDISMPGRSGVEATKLIKEAYPDINIVIQSIFDDDEYIFKAICNGASGYLLKNAEPETYVKAIQEVYEGGSPMTPGIARRVLQLFREGYTPPTPKEDFNLTEQERKVLHYLVAGKSYKMIADVLFISLETVKTHLRNIYLKLQVHSGTEAVAKALKHKITIL